MSLDRAFNIDDLRILAQKRLPRMIFDYIDGGADDEVSLRNNVSRFSDYQLNWKALVDVSEIDMSTTIMGAKSELPFIISPTAASRLFHPPNGERAVAKAATQFGTIFSISTLGSISIEEIGEICPGPKWFQVYVWKDRSLVENILERVKKAGFSGVILTVDLPVAGNRERDLRNDFIVPPKITTRTVTQMLSKPGYLWDMIRTPKIGPANFNHLGGTLGKGGIIDLIKAQLDMSITWDYADWLKKTWGGPMALKGISRADDAQRAVDMGIDAVWISNHGGRQLDTASPTIDLLPGIAKAIGNKADIILDGGIRRGTDIIKALALGATGVAIGRPYLFGLAAGGEAGVVKALEILSTELERNMQLMGCKSIKEITPDYVTLPRA